MGRRARWCVVAAVVVSATTVHADQRPEAEVGFGAGAWNAETKSIVDFRAAIGGRFDIGDGRVLHVGGVADLMFVETTTNNGLVELGAYTSLTFPLGSGWSFGPRASFEVYEKPIVLVGVRFDHRPVAFGIDALHMFASEKPTGVVASASLTGKAGAWGLAIGGVLALLFAAGSRGNG
jgi:hypothetical protein